MKRTFWHLGEGRRLPSDYEIVSSRLLTHPTKGIATRTDAWGFLEARAFDDVIRAPGWESVADPRATTYTEFVRRRRDHEAHVGALFAGWAAKSARGARSVSWQRTLECALPVMRYPFHAMQMVVAYLGHAAPASRITIACAFQAADELARVERLAQATRAVHEDTRAAAARAREAWESEPAWQPARALLERLLVTYGWGEALVALFGVVKPGLERALLGGMAERARGEGDHELAALMEALRATGAWHAEWAHAAMAHASKTDLFAERAAAWTRAWADGTESASAGIARALQDGAREARG